MKKLEEIKSGLGCLIPKPGREVPLCHEHTLCDCDSLMLVRCLEMAMKDIKSAKAYAESEYREGDKGYQLAIFLSGTLTVIEKELEGK